MKQIIHITAICIFLTIMSFFTIHCRKSDEISAPQVKEKIIYALKNFLPFMSIKVEPENFILETVGNGYYRATTKDVTIQTDAFTKILGMVRRYFGIGSSESTSYIKSGEVIVIFNPNKNICSTILAKKIKFYIGPPEIQENINSSNLSGLRNSLEIGKMISSNGDFIDKLPKEDQKDVNELISNPHSGKTSSWIALKNIKMRSSRFTQSRYCVELNMEIKKCILPESGLSLPGLSTLLSQRSDIPTPDFKKIINKNYNSEDEKTQIEGIKISISENCLPKAVLSLGNLSYSEITKSNKLGTGFNMGVKMHLKNLEVSIPDNKKIEYITNIKDLGLSIFIGPITPEIVISFVKLMGTFQIKRTHALSRTIINSLYSQMKDEFSKTKLRFRFEISRLKHYFGEIEGVFEAQMQGSLDQEETKIRFKAYKVRQIFHKLQEYNILSPYVVREFINHWEKNAIIQKNGNTSVIAEWKGEYLKKVQVNGKTRFDLNY